MGAQIKSIANMVISGKSEMPSEDEKKRSEQRQAQASRLTRILLPALTITFVVALSVVLYVFRQQIEGLREYAYAGVFVVSLLSSATVIVPVPGVLIFIPLLATLNPVLIGVVGAVGSIIGEMTGYAAGYSGRRLTTRGKTYHRVESWMKRRGSLIIFLFAALPILPMDVAGIVAGALHFPLWKFMVLGLAGKTIKYVGLMLAAAWGLQLIMPWITRFMN